MKIYKCDRCGKTEPEANQNCRPEKWRCLNYRSEYNRWIGKDICPECAEALKLPKNLECQDVADRLIEILEEIATGAAEEVVSSQ
jgi:hypothetical protein